MLKLGIAVALIAGAGFFFPQIYEGTGSSCAALEAKLFRDVAGEDANAVMVVQMIAGRSDGAVGRRIVAEQYPNLPRGIGCVVGYFDLNPSEIEL